MGYLLSKIALVLILISAGGFIVYIIKQQKGIFRWSYRILFAGFIFQTVFLIYQYYLLGTAPVIGLKAALFFFSWCIIGVYLIFQLKFGLMVLGSFIAPFAAVLMIVSSAIPGMESVVRPMLKSVWLMIHVGTIFIGDGVFAIAFMAAIMYLLQERQIKTKSFGLLYRRLPSLETLDSLNYVCLTFGFPLITVGLISGFVYAGAVLRSFWHWDPKEILAVITWLIYAVLLHERLAVGWRGRRAAIMAIVGFSVILVTFVGATLLLKGHHSFMRG